jgi:hypothetical protein
MLTSTTKKILLTAFIISRLNAYSQQFLPVTDSIPAMNEGLKAGYDITGASEKEVGDKGNFSRYKIHFYVINISSEAKLILYRPNSSIFGSGTSPELVKFRCNNATGARFTNKEATLTAKPCIIDGLVDETDASGKTVQKKKPANIGYWIKPGESINANTIMIVPLNERPNMTLSFFPNTSSMGGTVFNNNNNFYDNNNNYNNTNYSNNNNNNFNNGQNMPQGFVRIKKIASNNYLHNQNGPVACTVINHDWWSAQWEMLPVNGTNYYQIKNRWKNNFVSTDNNSMISDNGTSANAMWMIEETGSNSKIYIIRNAANNSKLTYQDGQLKTITSFGNQVNMQWIIEQ